MLLFCKADSNELYNLFVDMIGDVKANISPSTIYNIVHSFSSPHSWSSFKPVTLHDITIFQDKMKPSSFHTVVLPSMLYTSFDSIGPCIIELINILLVMVVVPSQNMLLLNQQLKKPGLNPSQPKNYWPLSTLPLM